MSSSNGSTEREINEYQDESNGSSGSFERSSNSSSQDEHYSSGVLEIPLKVFQGEMQRRASSRAEASSSRRDKLSSPLPRDEEENANVIYSCAPEVASTLDAKRLTTLVGRYQIPLEFNPRLLESGEWHCSFFFFLYMFLTY